MKNLLAAAFLVACLPASAQPTIPKQKVTVAPIAKVSVKQGASASIQIVFRVAPGYHINSNKPNSDLLIPTKISMDVPTNISIAKMTYPAGEELAFPFSPDEKLSVYTGDWTVKALVVAAKSAPRGTYRVHGELRYQACDNRACYPPTNVPVTFDVTIEKPAAAPHQARRSPAQSPHIHN